MTPSNAQTLFSTNPQLFRSLREFGFECEDGWFDLLARLFVDIEAQARFEGLKPDSPDWPEVVIVKQKAGTLRISFGYDSSDDTSDKDVSDAIRQLVETATQRSATTCEQCGAPARAVQTHPKRAWLKTLCFSCNPN